MRPAISIIVPVFNVEQFLPRCIESIRNQCMTNIEIILVDDGSYDRSGQICDQYEKLDRRIRVIHKKNGGLSDARNVGIDHAEGDYIGFVDSDDFINAKMYSLLYRIITENQCDIAEAKFQKVYDNSPIDVDEDALVTFYSSKKAMISGIVNDHCQTYVWNKLYKTKLWDDIRFPVGKLFEDEFTTYKIYNAATKIAVVNKTLYYYVQREESITRANFSLKVLDHCEALNQMMHFVESKYPEALSIAAIKYDLNYIVHLQDLLLNRKNIPEAHVYINRLITGLLAYSACLNNKKSFIQSANTLSIDPYRDLIRQRRRVKFILFILTKSVSITYILLLMQRAFHRLKEGSLRNKPLKN